MSDSLSDRQRRNGALTQNQSDEATGDGEPPVARPGRQRDGPGTSDGPTEGKESLTAVIKRLRGGGNESFTHLWGKLAVRDRKRGYQTPWFRGTYAFERTVSDWVADCLVTSTDRQGQDIRRPRAWIEFVVSADQAYRAKTRAALRFGFPMYWVFHRDADDARRAARRALTPDLRSDCDSDALFGVFDPDSQTLELGEPVTFEEFRVPVESYTAFHGSTVLGYRSGAAHIPRTEYGYDFGWVRILGNPYRAYSIRDERRIRLVPPGHDARHVNTDDISSPDSWLAREIAGGNVERVSPIPPTSTYERRSYANQPPRRHE